MKFNIKDKMIDTEKINLVAIDGTNTLTSIAGGYDRYHVTIRGNNGAEYNVPIQVSFDGAVRLMDKFNEIFKERGLRNFLQVGKNFIVNMDRVADYNWQYNLKGHQYIWVEFKDGSEYALYRGLNEKRAELIYNALNKVQKMYLQDIEQKKCGTTK